MAATYILGPFRLDAEAKILFRGAGPVALGQRAVALLRVLVESLQECADRRRVGRPHCP
jgi:DNA-binding winged helix-turn-helix (wHTH) protein